MNYIHIPHATPLHNRPSPMEDAIVQQVDWYMGKLNLPTDEFLKAQLDDDLWVDLSVILEFPKMKRMGVTDKSRVATLLHARSVVVEVDEKNARIRPAWARRSYLIISNLPVNTRLDQLVPLFKAQMQKKNNNNNNNQDSNSNPNNSKSPPRSVSHPSYLPGLVSIQQINNTTWYAVFDSPTGAQAATPYVTDKQINGATPSLEVINENSLQQSSDAFQSNSVSRQQPYQNMSQVSTSYAPSNGRSMASDSSAMPYPMMSNSTMPMISSPMMSTQVMSSPMVNPMGMPVPVMHHPSHDIHPPQYPPYASHTAYVSHAYPQTVGVPRQYINPRAMGPGGYVMTYPQHGHPYDPSQGIPAQTDGSHSTQSPQPPNHQQQQQVAQSQSNTSQPVPSKKDSTQSDLDDSKSANVSSTSIQEGTTDQIGIKSSEVSASKLNGISSDNITDVTSTSTITTHADAETESAPNGIPTDTVSGVPAGALDVSGRVADPSVAHNMADAQHMGHMPYSTMSLAMMQGQQMDQSLIGIPGMHEHELGTHGKGMGTHYMYHGAPMGDLSSPGMMPTTHARPGGRTHQVMMGRERGGQRDGNNRGGNRGSGVDGNRGNNANRKGKKGNRNQGRHGHASGHDRHDGRNRDGKGDGSSSDSGHRDGRGYRDEKPKPEPNLNSMDFPPLPMSDNANAKTGQPKMQKKHSKDIKDSKAKGSNIDGMKSTDDIESTDKNKQNTEKTNTINNELVSKNSDTGSSSTVGGTDIKEVANSTENTSDDIPKEDRVSPSVPAIGSTIDGKHSNSINGSANIITTNNNEKKNVDHSGATTQSTSPMSYAEILRSKKPTTPRTTVSPRGNTENSKSTDMNSNQETGGASTHNTNNQTNSSKDRNPRRKKSHNGRSHGHNDNHSKESDTNSSNGNNVTEKSNQESVEKDFSNSIVSGSGGGNISDVQKSKVDNGNSSRAHSVWANKPKSLFQAAPPQKAKEEIDVERTRDRTPPGSNINSNTNTNGSITEAKEKESVEIIESGNKDNGNDQVNNNLEEEQNNRDKNENRGHLNRMGAWAYGGPKQWPKSEKGVEG